MGREDPELVRALFRALDYLLRAVSNVVDRRVSDLWSRDLRDRLMY